MSGWKLFALGALVIGLSACGTSGPVTRNASFFAAPMVEQEVLPITRSVAITHTQVFLPENAPDLAGSVQRVFDAAVRHGKRLVHGERAVVLNVEIDRTRGPRLPFGGAPTLEFTWFLTDADSGELLTQPKPVKTRLQGTRGPLSMVLHTGDAATRARLSAHLAKVLTQEIAAN